MLRPATLAPLLALSTAGCLGLTPAPDEPVSYGATNLGVLRNGEALPDTGPGFERARPGEETRFGTPRMVDVLERAFTNVAARFPNTAPMRVGDLSAPPGGRHHRHGSHRTGRDVDVLFYVTDPTGRSRRGRGWLAYNRFGYAVEHEREDAGPAGGLFLFDEARNWHFVRTLLLDEEAGVQWIFVSRGVKARLLRYAIEHEEDPRALLRAASVLHQPIGASPHDDHFHVRVLCTPRERAYGCEERGPIWSWLRDREKGDTVAGEPLDDVALVRAITEPIEAVAEAQAADAGRGPT
ncbi:MAG: penicillin-insensitive murein endopeptidase [Sandaracinaceae bacterium]|nr:penicillin-insensitive murein endopeptidase [Sandaracinaceae bacterium]